MNVLIWGDTETSPALRHEVPLAIGDPFMYRDIEDAMVPPEFPVALADRLRNRGVKLTPDEREFTVGRTGSEPLIDGDVVAIEPERRSRRT